MSPAISSEWFGSSDWKYTVPYPRLAIRLSRLLMVCVMVLPLDQVPIVLRMYVLLLRSSALILLMVASRANSLSTLMMFAVIWSIRPWLA